MNVQAAEVLKKPIVDAPRRALKRPFKEITKVLLCLDGIVARLAALPHCVCLEGLPRI